MPHTIHFVDDAELPEGHDFMLVMLDDATGHLFYRESALSPRVLEDSWEAYRAWCCSHQASPQSRTVLRAV